MVAVSAVRSSGLHRWGVLHRARRPLRPPRPPLTRENAAAARRGCRRRRRLFPTDRNVDLLFMIDNSSAMRLPQDNLRRNFPTFVTALREPPRRPARTCTSRSSRPTWARATDRSPAARPTAARTASSSTPRAAPAPRRASQPGATYISDVAARRNYTGTLEDVFTCIAALGDIGLRLRAAARGDRARARRRRPRRARREPGLPAPGRSWPSSWSRTRTIAPRRRARPLRHRLEHEPRLAARPADQLPLQRVRAPVQRHHPEPPRAEQRRRRHGQLRGLHLRTTADGLPAERRRHRQPDQVAQGRRRPDHGRGDHRPADALRRRLEGAEHRRHVVRRGLLPVARDRTLLHGRRRQLRRSRRSHRRARRPFRRQRPPASICDDNFAPALGDIAENIVRYVHAPCIQGGSAKQPGTTRDDCTVTNSDTGNAWRRATTPAARVSAGAWSPGGTGCSGVSVVVQADPQGPARSAGQPDLEVHDVHPRCPRRGGRLPVNDQGPAGKSGAIAS